VERRNDARRRLEELMRHPAQLNIIHYSCESFYDREKGISPRITAIAVQNMASGQTRSFSIHQVGEIRGIDKDNLESIYNDCEKDMLNDFYDYVRNNQDKYWLHWNMRDSTYGFLAIAHRYRVLGGVPVDFSDDHLENLASLFIKKYGRRYVPDPRMEQLMNLNGISSKDFLTGKEEAQAFDAKDYFRLHLSTLRKVSVIQSFARQEYEGTLKTMASLRDQLGTSVTAWVEWGTGTWVFKLAGAIGIVLSLGKAIAGLM
jgi:hypothetical protein